MKAENIMLCRVEFGKNALEMESAEARGLTISQVIEDDKKFGIIIDPHVISLSEHFCPHYAKNLGFTK